ncbi:hypothetical protein [Butyrivibrio sp. FCS014]|uniref:hypothetical protein n=1 Tax=Butyrivibrio sp. FCS014 TaxID=1408304 RepID=UPI000466E49A|nr:hypothetical protein [Butyrivibrio sp. FCS014]
MINSDITMTYSAILRDKDGNKVVRVQFERPGESGKELAEGVLPDCVIVRQNGYSNEEAKWLEEYLRDNADDIMERAKAISNPLKWL